MSGQSNRHIINGLIIFYLYFNNPAVWTAHERQRHTELFLNTLTDDVPLPLPPRTPPTQQIPDPMYDNMEEIQFRATNRQALALQECPGYTKLPLQ